MVFPLPSSLSDSFPEVVTVTLSNLTDLSGLNIVEYNWEKNKGLVVFRCFKSMMIATHNYILKICFMIFVSATKSYIIKSKISSLQN